MCMVTKHWKLYQQIIQGEQKVPMYLLEVGYSEYTYGYKKC